MSTRTLNAIIACLFAGALGCACGCFFVLSSASDDFRILPDRIQDLGKIRQGTSTQVVFGLQSLAPKRIRILDVGTSCGCTTSELSQREFAYQDNAVLTLTYNSGQARGPIDVQAILIYEREGDKSPRSLQLRARGHIDPEYDVSPETLVFDSRVAAMQEIVLRPRHGNQLKVISATSDKIFLNTKLAVSRNMEAQTLQVGFDPKEYRRNAGPAHIIIHTDSKRQRLLMVPVEITNHTDLNAHRPLKKMAANGE